jgi:L-lactate dehydrogenase complex protein LldF
MTKDLRHRSLIQTALKKYEVARDARKARFQDWQSARQTAAEIKWDAINHLDKYLTELVDKLEARGTKAHWLPPESRPARSFLVCPGEKGSFGH